jgi:hypothetical protein
MERLRDGLWTQALAFAKARRLSPVALAGLGALAAVTALSALFLLRSIFAAVEPESTPHGDWRPPASAPSQTQSAAGPGGDLQTLSRPLFSKSRRPSPPSAVQTQSFADPGLAMGLALGAVVRTASGVRAYLYTRGGVLGEWRGVGEQIEGWTVAEIDDAGLTLKSGARATTLKLYPPVAGAVDAPVVPSPPAAPPPPLPATGPKPLPPLGPQNSPQR